jgi:hypothetical protein
MDVSGRTEADPAAEALVGSIIRYAAVWKPAPTRTALYAGDVAGKRQLELSGIAAGAYAGGSLAPDQVLVVGSGGGRELAAHAADVAAFVKAGGPVLALGLNSEDANAFLPFKVGMTQAEHIAAYFEAPVAGSLLAGVGPADVQNRDPRELPLIATGATVLGDGVLAKANGANVLFCQLPPQSVSAAGGGAPAFPGQANLRMTYRRASFELGRLLGNLGVSAQTPLLARFSSPTAPDGSEKRWLGAFYIDTPVDWDDPYRFFGW